MKEVLNVKSFHFHCSVGNRILTTLRIRFLPEIKTSAGKILSKFFFLGLGCGGLFPFSVGDHTNINN